MLSSFNISLTSAKEKCCTLRRIKRRFLFSKLGQLVYKYSKFGEYNVHGYFSSMKLTFLPNKKMRLSLSSLD